MRSSFIIGSLLLTIKLFSASAFIQVEGSHFVLKGEPYHFIGTNFWYGMHLGAPESGDQDRLIRELDRLREIGVTNLRIMAGSEGPSSSPWRVVPALQPDPGVYEEDLWQGLDFLLYEMGKRDMKAVVCLTNFWPWSGGMAQYVSWADGSEIPYPPPASDGSWLRYQWYASRFYADRKAQSRYDQHIRKVIGRRNHCSGILYTDDPSIMAWELANEPRAILRPRKYRNWIRQSAHLIKSLDKNHLVTIGSEGNTSSSWSGNRFQLDHSIEGIDYCTIHFWPENWGWYNPLDSSGSLTYAIEKMKNYLSSHLEMARRLNKPLVFEEFGLARDRGTYGEETSLKDRDHFYHFVLKELIETVEANGPLCGINFWAWSGEGRPKTPGGYWKSGHDLLGDPPHEKQGWYGVYDADTSTIELISKFAALLESIGS